MGRTNEVQGAAAHHKPRPGHVRSGNLKGKIPPNNLRPGSTRLLGPIRRHSNPKLLAQTHQNMFILLGFTRTKKRLGVLSVLIRFDWGILFILLAGFFNDYQHLVVRRKSKTGLPRHSDSRSADPANFLQIDSYRFPQLRFAQGCQGRTKGYRKHQQSNPADRSRAPTKISAPPCYVAIFFIGFFLPISEELPRQTTQPMRISKRTAQHEL